MKNFEDKAMDLIAWVDAFREMHQKNPTKEQVSMYLRSLETNEHFHIESTDGLVTRIN